MTEADMTEADMTEADMTEAEMAESAPVSAQPYLPGDRNPTPWTEARRRLAEARFYWLATVRPDGRPHVVPLLGVWLDGALHFCAGAASRKAKNLARGASCVIAVARDHLHLVVEGEAAKVTDEARLRRLAGAYAAKYGWQVTVRDGALHGDGAPTAGPPPYTVYEVIPTTAFGFGEDESFSPTRWRF
jgi:Pyridoxamine 5'-phosphate oxidase